VTTRHSPWIAVFSFDGTLTASSRHFFQQHE
jgi:hypothetical protein